MQWITTPPSFSWWEYYWLQQQAFMCFLSVKIKFSTYVTRFYDQVNPFWYPFTDTAYWMKRWSKGKMLQLSLEPSSWRDHNNKEVFIITHKSAPPNLRNLQTCSWIQVLTLIMSNDTSEIKGQWIGRICNTRLILTQAELAVEDPDSPGRLNPSIVPLTKSNF